MTFRPRRAGGGEGSRPPVGELAPGLCRSPVAGGCNVSRGFTLIELLVVIAVIAILAAVLFPVFARAREKARQAGCLSNVKQMALATVQYAQDYDETLPVAIGGLPDWSRFWGTVELLEPYVKNGQIARCPSDPEGAVDLSTFPGLGRYSYAWNRAAFAYMVPGMPSTPIHTLAQIPLPAETTCFFDGMMTGMALWASARHNDGVNVSFFDGHAKWNHRAQPPRDCTELNYHVIPQ